MTHENSRPVVIGSQKVAIPAWDDPGTALERAPLDGSVTADVAVVGAGISGLSTAYLLQRDGRRVVVLDDGRIGGGQTSRTSAHLASAVDGRYADLERIHGADGARVAAQSHSAAISCIERIVREEGIECDFRRIDGFLFGHEESRHDGAPPRQVADEHDAARRAGLEVELLPRVPGVPFDSGPCVRFANQGRFEPLRYLEGLARAFERAGGRIHTGTRVTAVRGGKDACVTTEDGPTVSCAAIVVATNSPINDRFVLHTKQAPYLTYVVAARLPRGAAPDALLWDTADPYHYVRLRPTGDGDDLLIVGGEDHKTGQARDGDARHARLERWAREQFPALGAVEHRWAGEVFEPADGLAAIGRNPADADNVFVVTGASGNGLTHGTIAGLLLTDLIAGRPNDWESVYAPSRMRLGGAGEALRENVNVAAQYTSWITPAEVGSEEEIAPGSGAVLRSGLSRIAAYRDEAGVVHRRSAACPHLGCVVAWNGTERTWDCPCHGSRFTATGRVIVGPAGSDLAPLDDEERPGVEASRRGAASIEQPR